MFSEKEPKNENVEAEKGAEETAEQSVGWSLSEVEAKDASDSIISSEWAQKAKEYLNGKVEELKKGAKDWKEKELNVEKVAKDLVETDKAAFSGLGVLLIVALKIAWGLLKFSYEAIKNKGQVKNAYEIGKEMFTFDDGKNKK